MFFGNDEGDELRIVLGTVDCELLETKDGLELGLIDCIELDVDEGILLRMIKVMN